MPDPSHRVPLWLGVAGVIALGGVLALLIWRRDLGWVEEVEPPEDAVEKSFNGSSEGLRQTEVVPTLDTPLSEGKSAVWCSSFQLAWNELNQEVFKGSVRLRNAQDVADRLNRAKQTKADLAPGSYYAAAGLVRDGIVERIQREMAEKFPDGPRPEFNPRPEMALGYAYLKAGVRYKHAFFNNTERFLFTDSSGKETAVRSFGMSDKEKFKDGAFDSFRGQIAVLWREGDEFAVDLSKESTPNQIVLARIRRGATLAEMVAAFRARVQQGRDHSHPGEEDTLLVPIMHWRVEHHFRELEGPDKRLVHPTLPDMYLGTALQIIEFKMDRRGAEVASQAKIGYDNGGPKRYHFDRPFLIYMKKRDAEHPFFVMWVDNAELLFRW